MRELAFFDDILGRLCRLYRACAISTSQLIPFSLHPRSGKTITIVMPTRAVLIAAGPTPWDVEGRIVRNSSLPLTAEAMVRNPASVG